MGGAADAGAEDARGSDEARGSEEGEVAGLGVATGPPVELPDAVRIRVLALAADALGRLDADQLPSALKRVAAFAPARRARLAGSQIAAVLEKDEVFRLRVAVQVRTELETIAESLEQGAVPAAADPVEVASVAYLLRPPGWRAMLDTSAAALLAERKVASSRQVSDQAERLRNQLDASQEQLRSLRVAHREEIARLKAGNTTLRHSLGDARAQMITARTAVESAELSAQEAGRTAATASAAAEAESRRLRGRLEELEAELGSLRRLQRGERGQEALRARLLLDTLLEAAQGLRRELALPAVAGSPADAVEADVAEHGSRSFSGHGSLATDDPHLLEQLLGLPRAHLVVDGYNVTKSTWPGLALDRQRDRLVAALAPLAARSGAEVTVVFDAAEIRERPLVNRPRNVRVLFSPVGVIADDVIRELVTVEPTGRPVVVVTSDRAVVEDVRRSGARTVAAGALSRLLARS